MCIKIFFEDLIIHGIVTFSGSWPDVITSKIFTANRTKKKKIETEIIRYFFIFPDI